MLKFSMSLNELFAMIITPQKLCHDNNSPLNLSRVSFGSFACESFGLDNTEELVVLFANISLISSEN